MKKVVLILALFFSCIAIYTQANKQGITTETITETITEIKTKTINITQLMTSII